MVSRKLRKSFNKKTFRKRLKPVKKKATRRKLHRKRLHKNSRNIRTAGKENINNTKNINVNSKNGNENINKTKNINVDYKNGSVYLNNKAVPFPPSVPKLSESYIRSRHVRTG